MQRLEIVHVAKNTLHLFSGLCVLQEAIVIQEMEINII